MAGLSPLRQGQTYPDAVWTFRDDNGNLITLPAGTTFTLYIYNPRTFQVTTGQGSWSAILPGSSATYSYSSNDTLTPMNGTCYAGFMTPGGKTGFTDEEQFVVLPLKMQQ